MEEQSVTDCAGDEVVVGKPPSGKWQWSAGYIRFRYISLAWMSFFVIRFHLLFDH